MPTMGFTRLPQKDAAPVNPSPVQQKTKEIKLKLTRVKSFITTLSVFIAVLLGPFALAMVLCHLLKPPTYTRDGQFAIGLFISVLAGVILGTGYLISNLLKARWVLILSGLAVVILCLYDASDLSIESTVPLLFGISSVVVGIILLQKK